MKTELVMTHLGNFDITSGKAVVTDPCYSSSGGNEVSNLLKGKWKAFALKMDYGMWGNRVKELIVWHESIHPGSGPDVSDWEDLDFVVGVDSGQAGIWDEDEFRGGEGDYEEEGTFYGDACKATMSEASAGIMTGGCVSSSGLGDGGYLCQFKELEDTPNNKICMLRIVYLDLDEHLMYETDEEMIIEEIKKDPKLATKYAALEHTPYAAKQFATEVLEKGEVPKEE